MFICENCGNEFAEPKIIKEPHPYGNGKAYEEIGVCPFCDEVDFFEAKQCLRCGEFVLETDNLGYCDLCHDEMCGG